MKVLIVSHNPVSDQSNMGKTFCSLFSGFAPEELCQLYIYPTVPNARNCGTCFRITDKDAMRAAFTRRSPGGEIRRIEVGQGMYENPGDVRLYKNRKNKSALRSLLRDAMWHSTPWYSSELAGWLEREAPDTLFVAPGGAKFLYGFALKIAEERRIPMVTYLCDEYYFVKGPNGLAGRLRLRLLQRRMEQLLRKTKHLVTISPELKAAYEAKFGMPVTVLMTGASISMAIEPKAEEKPTKISYFGNIRCGRYVSLAELGQELDAINSELGTAYRLNIYTAEQDETILSALKKHRSVELCGFLSGEAFMKTLLSAQLLLHAEAFDGENVDFVKHSISTKIADSLASGVPLLAYGPERIASMQHLIRNGCAITATSKEELRSMLLTAFTDGNARTHAVENALKAAAKFHSSPVNSAMLRQILEGSL